MKKCYGYVVVAIWVGEKVLAVCRKMIGVCKKMIRVGRKMIRVCKKMLGVGRKMEKVMAGRGNGLPKNL